jgi:hypothetical protein
VVKLICSAIEFIKMHEIAFLFIFIYTIYNLNGRTIGCGDTAPASLLPFSILDNHNLYLDQFFPYFQNAWHPPYFVIDVRGHYLSLYPIVLPILITPFYMIIYIFLKLGHYPIDMLNPGFVLIVSIMEKLMASMIASISAIFVYFSMKELLNNKIALITVFIYAFATNTWTISSQGLWQHGLVELLLASSIYLVIVNEKDQSNRNIVLLGVFSGIFIFNRPVESILLIPIIYYVLKLNDRRILCYFTFIILSSLPFVYYNLYYFGNLFGGYNSLLNLFNFDTTSSIRFIGLLLSPSRGLIIYTPILILSILGYFRISKIPNLRIRNFLKIAALSILLQIIIYSNFIIWWAGWSYGPRFLTGMLPFLIIYVGLYLNDYIINQYIDKKFVVGMIVILFLLFYSLFVQIVGAFYYPNGNWDGFPNSVDIKPEERVWNIHDTQIIRSFSAGMIAPTNPMDYIRYIWQSREQSDILSGGILLDGWHNLEFWDGTATRWMTKKATIQVYSSNNRNATLDLRALSLHHNRTLEIHSNNELTVTMPVSSAKFTNIRTQLHLEKGNSSIVFNVLEGCDRPSRFQELKNGDERCLSLAVQNITITA